VAKFLDELRRDRSPAAATRDQRRPPRSLTILSAEKGAMPDAEGDAVLPLGGCCRAAV
jgi:hypothetical protein